MLEHRGVWMWAAALALVVAGLSLHPIHETDAFWHLMLGRGVLEAGARTIPEPAALPDFAPVVVVPEWLWEVATYAIHELSGPAGLSIVVALLSAVCALAVIWMLRVYRPDATPAALLAVSTLVLAVVMARLRLRPQLAYLILLPGFIATTRLYLAAEGRRRMWLAAGLVVTTTLWAQLHGSFVIAPAIFGLLLLPQLRADWFTDRRPLHLAVGLGLVVAILTSADGAWVVHYVLVHGAGDAARHVGDMRATSWSDVNPVASSFAGAYWLLWALVLVGIGLGRKVDRGALGLALFGVALALNSVRFVATGALLLGPLALDAAHALARRVPSPVLRGAIAAAATLPFLWMSGQEVHRMYGPLGALGFADGAGGPASARYLERLPDGSAVLSTFEAGSAIGFWQNGRVRTYVDARTPLHFDDSDYAVAREVWTRPASLALALERYGAAALVTGRNQLTCGIVPEGWVPVVVEAAYSTFVPGSFESGQQPLVTLAPCGESYLTPLACAEGGARLDAEIAQMAQLGESTLLDFLRARRILDCGGDAREADRLLPSRREAWSFRKPRALARARIDLALGHPERALERMREPAGLGDLDALRIVMATETSIELLRETLQGAVRARDDDAPIELRAELARVCAQLGDADCVRFHGTRAAVSGHPGGPELLGWLGANHPDERVRTDSLRWLETMARRGSAQPVAPLAARSTSTP